MLIACSCKRTFLVPVSRRLSVLLEERQQLQAEHRSSVTARSKLEALCRDLQGHYRILRVCVWEAADSLELM